MQEGSSALIARLSHAADRPTASDEEIMAHFCARPGFLLARIDQISTALLAASNAPATIAQTELVLLLDRLGPMPQISLARASGTDKSTVGFVLDNLQARGWVSRAPCVEDRRRAQVALLEEARAHAADLRAHYVGLQRALVAPLALGEALRLRDLLHRLVADPASPAPAWLPACVPEQGVLDLAPSFLFRRALQHIQAQLAAVAPRQRFTIRQFSLLFIVNIRGSITQVAFARMFGIDPSTCAVIARGLVARGLLATARSPSDGRERVFELTAAGKAALIDYHATIEVAQRLALRGTSPAEIRWLVARLRTIVRAHSAMLRFPGLIS